MRKIQINVASIKQLDLNLYLDCPSETKHFRLREFLQNKLVSLSSITSKISQQIGPYMISYFLTNILPKQSSLNWFKNHAKQSKYDVNSTDSPGAGDLGQVRVRNIDTHHWPPLDLRFQKRAAMIFSILFDVASCPLIMSKHKSTFGYGAFSLLPYVAKRRVCFRWLRTRDFFRQGRRPSTDEILLPGLATNARRVPAF